MSGASMEGTYRPALRIHPDAKATLTSAVAPAHTDMTDFILRHVAGTVIEQAEHLALSERDSLHRLDALENPPAPNAKLLAMARRLPKSA